MNAAALKTTVDVRQKFSVRAQAHRFTLRAWFVSSFAAVVFSAVCSASASADAIPETHAVSIGGYSPVSYFTKGVAEMGSANFAVTHNGRVFYLTSAEQMALFNKTPDKYRPRHDVCSFSLTDGTRRALDPTNFKVIGDTLLMFHKVPGTNGLEGWNASELTDDELLARADNQFLLLRF